jgi:hypothetical protein
VAVAAERLHWCGLELVFGKIGDRPLFILKEKLGSVPDFAKKKAR